MKTTLALFCLALLAGCASLNNAGTASYRIKPMELSNGTTICCDITIDNGKEYAALEARILKHGDDYEVYLSEKGVAAFDGQRIASVVALESAKVASTAAVIAGGLLIAPIAGAAIAAGTVPAAVAGGALGVGAAKVTQP